MQMKFPLLAALLGLLAAFPAHAQTEPQSETVKAWKAGLSAHIASNRFFPVGARGQTGKAKVTFVIDRSGTLISRALAESAGSRSLDDAALAIIARAEPFPAPPSELKEDSFPFTVQIVFSGRQFQVPPLGVVLSRPDPASTDPASTEADPMAAWRKTVTEHVWRHRAFPPEAIGQRGDAGVTFVVDRSGKLISNALVESTGFAPLDAADARHDRAIRAVPETARRGERRPAENDRPHELRRDARPMGRSMGGRSQGKGQAQQRLPGLLNRIEQLSATCKNGAPCDAPFS